MRTTIRLDSHLLAEAKQLAARTGRTLTAVIEDALHESLARRSAKPAGGRVRLISSGEGGLRAGVDLNHTAELLELMDHDDDPH